MYHPVHAFTKKVQYRNPEKFGPGKYFCLMGVLYMDICILVIHGEFINGRGLYKILSKSIMSTTGIQHLFTGSDVKTTRYCIKVAASAIYLKWIQTHRRLPSDLESTKELEQVPKTSPMCNY